MASRAAAAVSAGRACMGSSNGVIWTMPVRRRSLCGRERPWPVSSPRAAGLPRNPVPDPVRMGRKRSGRPGGGLHPDHQNASAAAEADFDAPSAFRSLSMTCEGYIRRGRHPLRTAGMPPERGYGSLFGSVPHLPARAAEYAALQAPLSGDPAGESADGTMPGHATITIREQEEEESGTDAD